jgi:hypothetical protein
MAGDNVTPISEALRGATVAPDFTGEGDGDDPFSILPEGCPFTVLGKEGLTIWLLDHCNQLLGLKPRDLDKGSIQSICGDDFWLLQNFPQYTAGQMELPPERRGPPPKFNQDLVQRRVINAGSAAGMFNPSGKVFGRGAHRRALDDALVLHLGDRVLLVGAQDTKGRKSIAITERRPGKIDGKLYPGFEKLPAPAAEPSTVQEAERLQALFGKWYFFEPDVAPLLLLGWVAHAMICGALGWRSHVWLTGETAAGKSTLQKVIRAVLAEWGLFTEDATEAAVRHVLLEDTLPVLIDEAEADDRAERQRNMVNLARKGSSGAKMHRGSSDQGKAHEFTVQSAFLFSSILHAPLDPQDRNRFAILAMRQIPEGAEEPILDLRYWREAGRRMQRRMIEQWPRFDKTLATYKDEIRTQGFQGRWRDTFGTLLACADMLLHDCAPSDDSMLNEATFGRQIRWVRMCVPLMERGALEAEDTTTRCITKLTSTLLPARSGHQPETVGRWIRRATEYDQDGLISDDAKRARAHLLSHGLAVVNLRRTKKGAIGATRDFTLAEQLYVVVGSKSNSSSAKLFETGKWADGGWTQALKLAMWKGEDGKAEPIVAQSGIKFRFDGNNEYVVAVPIEALIGVVSRIEE